MPTAAAPDRPAHRTPASDSGPLILPFRAPAFRLGHRPWLDGMRGLDVLFVLAHHLRLLPGGLYGVDGFFVLSGFLITCLLAEEWNRTGGVRLGCFYLRRALRLLPAFAVLLAASYLMIRWVWPADEPAGRRAVAVAACYLSNWPSLHHCDLLLLAHTWSLSVEEQFYLVWPVLLLGLLRAGASRRLILSLVIGGIALIALHRAALFADRPPNGPEWDQFLIRAYVGLDTRGDALLVGCLTGLVATWGRLPRGRWSRAGLQTAAVAAALGVAYLTLQVPSGILMYEGGFTALALMVGVVILCQLQAPVPVLTRLLESKPLTAAGRVSYALYLFHIPILALYGPDRVGLAHPGGSLLVAGLSVGAAVVSYYVVERPFLRLKGRVRESAAAVARRAA